MSQESIDTLKAITALMKEQKYLPILVLRAGLNVNELLRLRKIFIDYMIQFGPINDYDDYTPWKSPVHAFKWDGQQYKYEGPL